MVKAMSTNICIKIALSKTFVQN